MILKLILKQIKITNNDTDSYGSLIFSLELDKNINLTELYNYKHKVLELDTDTIKIKK